MGNKLVEITKKNRELYAAALKNLEEVKHNILVSITNNIKCIAAKPIHVGNMWFYFVNYNGEDVPAYCHMNDYDPENPKFLPIYDEENTGEFGWSDFEECCRIFDMINNKLKDTK